MKRVRIVVFAVALGLMAAPVHGASLSYTPDNVNPTIAAGSEITFPIYVSLRSASYSFYRLWFVDHVSSGNLPQSWLIATPDVTFINARLPRASTNLTIRVPEGTEPGVYSGILFSKAMAAHDVADSGRGLHIAVTVPSDCQEVARFEIVSVSPQLLWPPNHGMEEVTVSRPRRAARRLFTKRCRV